MINFNFYTPTKIFFGKDTHRDTGKIIKSYGFKKILLHYGKESIKKSGLYDDIVKSLKENEIEFVELGGVKPNPELSLVLEGVKLAKENNVDMILAVGGGSVIDSSKSIGVGAKVDFSPFLFNLKEQTPKETIPVGTVLTIAAAGSEMSDSCVITDTETQLKRGFNFEGMRPLFSILNPELTYTLPPFQTACGIVDIMMHTLERYFSKTKENDLADRIAEGLLKAVIDAGKAAMKDPYDYEARATLMWASTLSHNGLTGAGKEVFFTCHQMAHEINGIYDTMAHGETLAIVFPAWAKYMIKYAPEKLAQFAVRVMGCDYNFENPEKTAYEGIERIEEYFKSLGMPVSLKETPQVDLKRLPEMAEKCTNFGKRKLNCFIPLGKEEIIDIYELMK